MTTLFFATDIHGSDICWNKFLNAGKFYGADVLVLGGDMTGKAIVPVVRLSANRWRVTLLEQESELESEDELQDMLRRIRSRGYYPYLTDPDEIQELTQNPQRVDAIFTAEVLKTAEQWLKIAETKLTGTNIRCFVSPGNDDMFALDDLIRQSKVIHLAEGEAVEIDSDHQMISSGWSNPTPWHTFREESDDRLLVRYESMIRQLKNPQHAIFNFHVPPHASGLDDAPELDSTLRPKYAGNSLIPVGSIAARKVIEQYKPVLSLHGHIHEARGATRLGRTLAINPGSMYEQGYLYGALIQLTKDKIKNYILTNG